MIQSGAHTREDNVSRYEGWFQLVSVRPVADLSDPVSSPAICCTRSGNRTCLPVACADGREAEISCDAYRYTTLVSGPVAKTPESVPAPAIRFPFGRKTTGVEVARAQGNKRVTSRYGNWRIRARYRTRWQGNVSPELAI